jgi:hypothetical protein
MLKQKPKPTANEPTEYATVANHVETCPDCAETVVDGQGLLACTDCDWTALVA